ALGAVVSSRPPSVVDLSLAGFFFGQATPVALGLTRAGLFPTYVALCILSLVFGAFYRAWLPRAIIAIVALVVAWQVSDLFKFAFHRPRMDHWLGVHETSYSYASGHAVLALTFWGIWVYYLRSSGLAPRVRVVLGSAIALLVLGIGWSRLALGAHYASDVLGGYALGGAFVCCAVAVDRWLAARTPAA
ncbi:MAG: phosphatase PAP2 family protein, partial [Candidatus Baltobacteraceae bacterium]